MPMLRRLFVALALILVAPAALAAEPYTSAPLVREKGFEALVGKMGENRPVVRLTVSPDQIVAVTQADSGSATSCSVLMRESKPRPATEIANVPCHWSPHASTHL